MINLPGVISDLIRGQKDWGMSQVVKHEFKEQKEPKGLTSRPSQAEKPGGSSQSLMEEESDSAKDRCQVRVWVANSPQVQAGE